MDSAQSAEQLSLETDTLTLGPINFDGGEGGLEEVRQQMTSLPFFGPCQYS